MAHPEHRPVVVVAGASGFVGTALLPFLARTRDVVALSRSKGAPVSGVRWEKCDLFSLLQTERALVGADYAVYLVHSMLPARLTQARFEDMDFILADNFARSAARAGVKQIVYLGGIIPDDARLSRHLASRLEVERVLSARGVPVTSLRAGLIIGPRGSSFRIVMRLVRRSPLLLCPHWTRSMTQPAGLNDVVQLIDFCLGRTDMFGRAFDVGGPDVMSYVELMRRTAARLGKRRCIVAVPFVSSRLSTWGLRAVTGAHRELIAPLVESLRHAMVAHSPTMQERAGIIPQTFDEALEATLRGEQESPEVEAHLRRRHTQAGQGRYVCSIQRLPLPPGRDAIWVAREYARWLPLLFRYVLRVTVDEHLNLAFRLTGFPRALLELRYSQDRSSPDRPLYYITGGLLAREADASDGRAPARLEFRESPDRRSVLAAIFNYRPSLPWWFYRLTQAPIHLLVMKLFAWHLARQQPVARFAPEGRPIGQA
ncbi:MAG: NAD-dependent epimerase/dehydratase family protein [Chthoniobacterales bacterium]|nr:NAD-dependent epimerase/dehydratase family protein [Chthoniobacterales bacterium]